MPGERQLLILKAIVEEFIQTAEPVGSKTLIAKYDLPYSSATIRNEMMDLEEQGYLEKTHTSSGRVPSVAGYRFYVENLMSKQETELEYEIASLFDVNYNIQEVIKRSCEVLSKMTSLTSVVLGPDCQKQKLEHIKLFPINEQSAVAVFITDVGHTENRVFNFESSVSLKDLEVCTGILNDRLKGTLIAEVVEKLEAIKPLLAQSIVRYEVLFKAFLSAFNQFASECVYLSGQNNLLYHPEFANIERFRSMMSMLEDNQWFNLITGDNSMMVKMNERTDLIWYSDMAVVTSKFKMSEQEEGEMIVVGPNRMHYDPIVSLINAMAETIEALYRKR